MYRYIYLNNVSVHVKVISNNTITANIITLLVCLKFIVHKKGKANHFWNDLQ